MNLNISYKNIILENDTYRYCEIYKITNKINQKVYIGQCVSHILNHKKFRPYGMNRRFNCHVSEAFSKKKNQCHYLNNSIRKYGPENFIVQLICNCTLDEADMIETSEISKNNSLFPNGYNLNTGGMSSKHTNESKKRVSNGLLDYFKDKKFYRFLNIGNNIDNDFEKYIRPLNRNKIQYGWYVYIQGKKADFGGSHISLIDSKQMAINFIKDLKELLAKLLVAGNP